MEIQNFIEIITDLFSIATCIAQLYYLHREKGNRSNNK